jgi:hypothetical protein
MLTVPMRFQKKLYSQVANRGALGPIPSGDLFSGAMQVTPVHFYAKPHLIALAPPTRGLLSPMRNTRSDRFSRFQPQNPPNLKSLPWASTPLLVPYCSARRPP